ncbi:GNAT family N-acetyltransferase [Arenibacter sp. BSSL-BM3]|uniref:GNAT family N-acetyltransferase n=1 Tax=Arenibacter arenosicollis TaxID=2762274 RepID=A0ABR7QHV4_9FLAO|nr:GNAT family N-acetyltransferase [Arenibacter arenosicollis]MBC8766530.1 GNAT family N-acetyltransferase [Arenibacter arenosicollis]
MEVIFKSCTNDSELRQILSLQQKNLISNLDSGEKEKEGFVTVSHTLELLTKMNTACPHIIAKVQDKVVGYALCMHPSFGNDIEVLKPMFKEIASTVPKTEPYMVMGQICIDKEYRRRGIFRKLYETMKNTIQPQFNSIITEVDATNLRSLEAHYAVGFKDLKTYSAGGQDWKLIVLR